MFLTFKDIPLSVQSQLPSVEDIEIELAALVRNDVDGFGFYKQQNTDV